MTESIAPMQPITPEVSAHRVELLSYLKTMTPAKQDCFAQDVGTTIGQLKQIAYGVRPCKVEYAQRIDKLSKGKVDMRKLCPQLDYQHLAKVGKREPIKA